MEKIFPESVINREEHFAIDLEIVIMEVNIGDDGENPGDYDCNENILPLESCFIKDENQFQLKYEADTISSYNLSLINDGVHNIFEIKNSEDKKITIVEKIRKKYLKSIM